MRLAFNRRHKTLLFLTLVGLGSSLLFGADAKQVAGIALLGLAAAWLIGGMSVRTLGLLLSIVALLAGIGVAALPILVDWHTFQTDSSNYAQAVKDLTDAIRKAPMLPKTPPSAHFGQEIHAEPWPEEGNVVKIDGPPWKMTIELRSESFVTDAGGKHGEAYVVGDRIVDIPPSARGLEGPWSKYVGSSTPDFIPELISVAVFPRVADQEILEEIETQLLVPNPSFSAWGSLREHTIRSLGGLVLILCGVVGLLWWGRARNAIRDLSSPSTPS